MTAVKEANQGFVRKMDPCVMCSYDVDCEDIADLRTYAGRRQLDIDLADLDCPWFAILTSGGTPPSWSIATMLISKGLAGIVVPSFAPGATDEDHNLVLWDWSDKRPHMISVHDPSGRLPKNALSWS